MSARLGCERLFPRAGLGQVVAHAENADGGLSSVAAAKHSGGGCARCSRTASFRTTRLGAR
jgi:hypothetical protein